MTLLSFAPCYADILLFGGRLEAKTKECKQIRNLYDNVLERTSSLMEEFSLESPVAICAMYTYLYRNGYLSKDHQFKYTMKLKDLPRLYGADVINGNGVCRSLASFLSDLYEKMGYDSETISVNASSDSCRSLDKLCPTPLNADASSKKIVKIVSKCTGVIKVANHMITRVSDNGYNYVLDPTNDGILYSLGKKFVVLGHEDIAMTFSPLSTSINRLSGRISGNVLLNGLNDKLNFPSIDIEEYRTIYLETLKMCQENPDILEQFYCQNSELYEEIASIMMKQKSLIGRQFPVIK